MGCTLHAVCWSRRDWSIESVGYLECPAKPRRSRDLAWSEIRPGQKAVRRHHPLSCLRLFLHGKDETGLSCSRVFDFCVSTPVVPCGYVCNTCFSFSCAVVRVCRFGFDVAHYREMSPRKEKGSPVQGQLIALVKRGEGAPEQEEAQQEPDDAGNEL